MRLSGRTAAKPFELKGYYIIFGYMPFILHL